MTLRTSLIAVSLLAVASCQSAEDSVTPGAAPDARQAAPAGGAELADSTGEVFFCPMDLDVRSNTPGSCPRCGMALVSGLPEPRDYDFDLDLTPRVPQPGGTTTLRFTVRDPWEGHVVSDFEIMHEKLIHTFVVSQDLEYFAHVHPTQTPDGSFLLDVEFPRPGLYQVLGDFYPVGGTPQLVTHSVIVPGGELEPARLGSDYETPRDAENITVRLVTNPAVPLAGQEVEMYFTITPEEGLEQYIGAWGHMLAVSDDLVDTIHGHPFIADGSGEMLFHLLFPRAHTYRVWVQFQRNGVVNTVQFDIPVEELTL